jgi:hypothetical protein
VGYSDGSWILRQCKITSTLQLSQLTGVISLGVEDKNKPRRTTVEGLAFRKPDLLPQPFPLKERQGPTPDAHRLGSTAQPMNKNGHDAIGRRSRLIVSSATIRLPLADDLDDGPEFRHLRIVLPR